MSDSSGGEALVPIDAVEPDDLRDYLLSCGWTSDGKKLRWEGHGKRTLREAREEQRSRELRDTENQVRITEDEFLIRRAYRSGERQLIDAALANPRAPRHLVQDAFERGNFRSVAGSRALDDRLLETMLPTLMERARAEGESHSVREGIAEAVVTNPLVPLPKRMELVAQSFRWMRPNGAVDVAVSCDDPTIVDATCKDLVARYREYPVHELDRRRELVALIEQVAANPAATKASFELIASLEYMGLDEILCENPMLPAVLYRRLAPLVDERWLGQHHLEALAAVESDRLRLSYHGLPLAPRRLWYGGMSRRDFMADPEGALVHVALLDADQSDGDLVVVDPRAREDFDHDQSPRLWVPLRWPRSPRKLHYRGFGHGLTVDEAGPFLRRSGAAILSAWPKITRAYLEQNPEVLIHLAHQWAANTEQRQWQLAAEAVSAGMSDTTVARRLRVPVKELRSQIADTPASARSASPVADHEHTTMSIRYKANTWGGGIVEVELADALEQTEQDI